MSAADLAAHYRRFGVADRLLLTGHSHQAWPDVALEGQIEAFDDAALAVDEKWGRAFAKADRLRAAYGELVGDPGGDVALGANTHELVVRFLSAIDITGRPKLITTDGEFHTLRRQLGRLAEEFVRIVRVPAEPADTLAERLASEVDDKTAAVLVSAVLFETARIVPGLAAVAAACERHGVELLVDAYHALGVVPFDLDGLADAWIVGGGYKYLQLGEGNCFLRLPGHAQHTRPVITGWYAEFAALADERDPTLVAYGPGATRFAGATYDPTSHYRAARVLDFFAEQGLTAARLREISLHQNGLLASAFDELGLPDEVVTRDRDTPRSAFAGFLSLRAPRAQEFQRVLAERGVLTDSRGEHLRFGPAPYLRDDQLRAAVAALGEIAS
ncbi:kynureninase [Actinokineospora diospyrosa]|uniref:Selenocysteine lyase/Cysteine desulfurase n=1 Tax=Actinokineospora diospyrosa TaxID=103728 RepID=A0ABT1ILT1_9PSEU|nr:kynureninase [Actinokineospora diospyrosa]MCP2273611.1 Selenocysteine lyase/Cysteine desulfurase [Actinokineospora diospyrosa]